MAGRLIVFVQGATESARRGVFADDAMDDKGRALAVAACRRVPKHDRSFTSPTVAARETAKTLGLRTAVDPELRDLDVGQWQGRSLDEIAARDPTSAAAFVADPDFRGHGGESITDLMARAAGWLEEQRASDDSTIVVASAAVVRAMATAALDATARTFWRIDVAPLGTLTLRSDGRRWALRALEPA